MHYIGALNHFKCANFIKIIELPYPEYLIPNYHCYKQFICLLLFLFQNKTFKIIDVFIKKINDMKKSTIIIPSTIALKCFEVSARLLSFTKAAVELGLTQGAVSHHILLLEKQLMTPLFERNSKGLKLTYAGDVYLREISLSLRQLEKATIEIASIVENRQILNLSCTASFANHWLMPRMHSFSALHPEIIFNLSTKVGLLDFASAKEEDASIEFCFGPENGIEAQLILRPEFRLCISKKLLDTFVPGARKPDDVSEAQLIHILQHSNLIRDQTVFEAWPEWLAQAGLSAEVTTEHLNSSSKFTLLSMVLNAVMTGLGVALLPHYMSLRALQSGDLVELRDVGWVATRAYYLRWPKNRPSPKSLIMFTQWLKEQSVTSNTNLPDYFYS